MINKDNGNRVQNTIDKHNHMINYNHYDDHAHDNHNDNDIDYYSHTNDDHDSDSE